MAMESSANPPRVSATTGMTSTPAERQAERWDASLRWTPTCRAWPGVEAALCKVSCWRGEITCTSSAAGRPRLQVGRSMSAGLEWESGTTLGASLVGAKAADRGSVEEDVTDGIVPSDSVPVASHTQPGGLHRGPLCCSTLGRSNCAMKWHSQPVPQAAAELLVMKVEPQGSRWHAVQPVTGMW